MNKTQFDFIVIGAGSAGATLAARLSENPEFEVCLIEAGGKAIWFHTGKTETVTGMDPFETQEFLKGLLEEAVRDEFAYVHEWTLGDLLIVDNRSAMHKAGADYDMAEHRKLYRTMVRGDRPY